MISVVFYLWNRDRHKGTDNASYLEVFLVQFVHSICYRCGVDIIVHCTYTGSLVAYFNAHCYQARAVLVEMRGSFWRFCIKVIGHVQVIAPKMEAASISETSVNFCQTTRCKSQKTAIFILAAVRTWNLTWKRFCLSVFFPGVRGCVRMLRARYRN
jgi:hypothetical protein